jgi:hypothetical protein
MEDSTAAADEATQIATLRGGTITVRDALSWWISALRLWRIAPVRLTLVCLLPLLIEFAAQMVPTIGVPLSKVLVPFATVGWWVVFHETWTARKLRLGGLLWSFRRGHVPKALQIALISLTVFVVQLGVAVAIYGAPAFDAVVLGHMAQHRELAGRAFVLTLILPGVVPGILLMFIAPLIVFEGRRPLQAAVESIRVMLSSPFAFVLTCVISALLLGAALVWVYGALMLLVYPWMSMMGYGAYRNVFAERRAPANASVTVDR